MAGMTAENDHKTSRPIGKFRARVNRRQAGQPTDGRIHYTYAASKMLKITAVRRVEEPPGKLGSTPPSIPHASGRPRNSLIFLLFARALVAHDAQQLGTFPYDSPQKPL
ncbi:hypothetical protein D9M72_604120 [compost metagenome]